VRSRCGLDDHRAGHGDVINVVFSLNPGEEVLFANSLETHLGLVASTFDLETRRECDRRRPSCLSPLDGRLKAFRVRIGSLPRYGPQTKDPVRAITVAAAHSPRHRTPHADLRAAP